MRHTLLFISIVALLSMIAIESIQAQTLVRHDSYYTYGNQRLYKEDISKFLKANCPDAYDVYHNKQLKIGWGICVPSMAMLVGGAVMSFASRRNSIVYTGIAFGAAGAVGILSSAIVLSRGYEIRRSTCNVFNNRCSGYTSATPLILNVNASPQELSMALQF